MSLQTLLNKGYCTDSAIFGTALDFCPFDIKRLKIIWRHPLGFKYPNNFEFTKENIQKLVQKGKIIPLYKTKNTTWVTPENAAQTFEGGDKKGTDKMPYEFTTNFTNGYQYHVALNSLEKAGVHSFTFIDIDDTIWVEGTEDGGAKGIDCEYLSVEPYNPQGQNAAGTMVKVQLASRIAIDEKLKALLSKSYAFSPETIKGVSDVVLTLTAPVNATNILVINAKQLKDQHLVEQSGLDQSDIQIQVGGVTVPGTLAYTAPGVYTFTRTTGNWATGNVITTKLYDSTEIANIIVLDDTMLRSNVAQTIAVPA